MNEQICVSTNIRINKRVNEQMFECLNKQINKCTNVYLLKCLFVHFNKQTFNHSIYRLHQSLFCLLGYLMVRYE